MAELGGRSRMGVGLSGTPYSPGWDAWGMAGLVSYWKWVWPYTGSGCGYMMWWWVT